MEDGSAARKLDPIEGNAETAEAKGPVFPFALTLAADYLLFNLGEETSAEVAARFEAGLPELFQPAPKNIIINCENLQDLGARWTRALMQLHRQLKAQNKAIRLIAASPAIRKLLESQGLDASLKCCDTLKDALTDIGCKRVSVIDVNFINPFLTATLNVLKVQCSTEARPGKPFRKSPTDKYGGDISGVIGLVSDAFSGSVVISFQKETFLSIMSLMLGEPITEINQETQDGAGELTNIIFGQAKVELNNRGFGIKTALPSVVMGENHTVLQMANGARMVIPFETDAGPFFIEICTIDMEPK